MKTAIVAVALCLAAPAIAEDAVPLPRARPSEVIDDLARKEWVAQQRQSIKNYWASKEGLIERQRLKSLPLRDRACLLSSIACAWEQYDEAIADYKRCAKRWPKLEIEACTTYATCRGHNVDGSRGLSLSQPCWGSLLDANTEHRRVMEKLQERYDERCKAEGHC